MKKIGIVGGVTWRSTVDYYSELCRRSEEWSLARDPQAVPSIPEISIESLDENKAVSYLGSDDNDDSWRQFEQYHRAALKRLQESGAEFAVIASNSPHHRFAEIVRGVGIPVISILEAMATISARCGVREILILGTLLAMKSPVFHAAFAKHGIEAAGPRDETIKTAMVELITNLQLGKINGAAERLGKMARKSFEQRSKAQPAVCLACTELPLAFEAQKMLATFEYDGILYINSTAAHIDAAFDFAVSG